MQKNGEKSRVSRETRKNIHDRKVKQPESGRRGSGKTGNSRCALSGNDFLKETIKGIYNEPEDSEYFQLNEEESRENLFLCFKNYLSLMGKPFEFKKTGNYRKDISLMCYEFKNNLPEKVNINLDLYEDGGLLEVKLYHIHHALAEKFVFLPISAIDRMPIDIADAFRYFVCFYHKTQQVDFPDGHQDFAWAIGDVLDEYLSYPEDNKIFIETAENYNSGHICEEMNRIRKSLAPYPVVLEKLNSLLSIYPDGENNNLLKTLITGVELLDTDCILSYDYDPEQSDESVCDDYGDYPPVEVSRTFCIVWEISDGVSGYVCENINAEFSNTYCNGLVDYRNITKDTKELFSISDYPDRFEGWFNNLNEILQDYGKSK